MPSFFTPLFTICFNYLLDEIPAILKINPGKKPVYLGPILKSNRIPVSRKVTANNMSHIIQKT